MFKTVRRMISCPCYETESVQSRLENMATKGLILQSNGIAANFAAFARSEPKTIRYRLIPSTTTDAPSPLGEFARPLPTPLERRNPNDRTEIHLPNPALSRL